MKKVAINNAKLKEVLPHGACKEVAKRSKTSIYTVSRVLNGRSNNMNVVNEIRKYVEELRTTKEQINETVEALNVN